MRFYILPHLIPHHMYFVQYCLIYLYYCRKIKFLSVFGYALNIIFDKNFICSFSISFCYVIMLLLTFSLFITLFSAFFSLRFAKYWLFFSPSSIFEP